MPNTIHRLLHLATPRLLKPSHIGLLAADLFGLREPIRQSTDHLSGVMHWILRSCEHLHRNGSSAGYSVTNGWRPAYPETTGYIIPTLYRYFHYSADERFRQLAIDLAAWESRIQMACGAVQGGYHGRDPFGVFTRPDVPVVFNTGMVILGWAAAWREERSDRARRSLQRGADWLLSVQEPDGSWLKGRSEATSAARYTYYTMVAWALAEAWEITGRPDYREAAERFLTWVLSLQERNGFIPFMSFDSSPPLLHTICYTLQGLVEAGRILGRSEYVAAAIAAADRLMRRFERHGRLHARYDDHWKPVAEHSCVTGDAQMSIVLTELSALTGDLRYFNTALKINDTLKGQQPMRTGNADLRGGMRGSRPIWGGYSRLNFPNWAAKFYADALLAEERHMNDLMLRISSDITHADA